MNSSRSYFPESRFLGQRSRLQCFRVFHPLTETSEHLRILSDFCAGSMRALAVEISGHLSFMLSAVRRLTACLDKLIRGPPSGKRLLLATSAKFTQSQNLKCCPKAKLAKSAPRRRPKATSKIQVITVSHRLFCSLPVEGANRGRFYVAYLFGYPRFPVHLSLLYDANGPQIAR